MSLVCINSPTLPGMVVPLLPEANVGPCHVTCLQQQIDIRIWSMQKSVFGVCARRLSELWSRSRPRRRGRGRGEGRTKGFCTFEHDRSVLPSPVGQTLTIKILSLFPILLLAVQMQLLYVSMSETC